ncbi:MAG: hypothetical protein R3B09_29355 [Nannocystaceae bacterium]
MLYVGNSTNNGDLNTADLDAMTQEMLLGFPARITAGAPVSPVHIVLATLGGEINRYNTLTKTVDFVVDLEADVTSLAHDPFDGSVYASLSTLEIVRFHPFTGDVDTFDKMPGKGRVAVSPSGKLWYTPVKYIANFPLSSYDLPSSF